MAKTDTQTTKSVNGPNDQQAPYYDQLYKAASQAFQNTNGKVFQGQTYAEPNATQLGANQSLIDASGGMGTGVDELRKLAISQLNGDWLNPNTNPYIAQVAQAAINPVQQQFSQNLNAVKDRAITQGAYGGSRQDLQENRALQDFTTNAGNITAGIYGQNYANERGIQQNSGSLLDKANLLALAGPTTAAAAGATQQGWDQAALDDAKARFDAQQSGQWAGISELANTLGSGGFGSTTQTNTQPTNTFASILQGLLGGATTGASLARGIGGVAAGAGLGAFAPWMAPIAALGGLAGAL